MSSHGPEDGILAESEAETAAVANHAAVSHHRRAQYQAGAWPVL